MLRLLILLLLLPAPALAQDELAPTFPKPASEGGPALPEEAPIERPPGFPAPASEGGPALPEGELTPTFPTPEPAADDDDSGGEPTPAPTPEPMPEPSKLEPQLVEAFDTTQQLAIRIDRAEGQLMSLGLQRNAATTPRRFQELEQQIAAVKAEAETMRGSLRKLAGGVDMASISEEPQESISWEDELSELAAPIVQELKRATERPRETERLRIRSAHYGERLILVDEAVGNVQALLGEARNPLHRAELEALLEVLQETRRNLEDELEVAQGALANLELDEGGFVGAVSQVFRVFFADRGRNVITAFGAFFGVLLLLLLLRHYATRALGVADGRRASLWFRVLDLSAVLGTVLAAAFSGLAVLFVSGDWVLLTLAALVLFGFFWGARQSIPRFWNEMRLLLNIGPVREGERVVHDDLPWLVESLHFVSILRNPAFPGVHIRLPMAALEELVSRPFLEEEPWFPTRVGDIVDMGDDGWGPVVFQSPEVVQARIAGVLRTYSATDWFAEPPVNLSTGWRTDVLLTLDYSHQDQITGAIPEQLQAYLRAEFADHELAKHLQSLTVGFEQMGASSLDLEVTGWFDGAGAERWEAAEEDLAALCVDACNKFGWTMAFPQLTVSKRAED